MQNCPVPELLGLVMLENRAIMQKKKSSPTYTYIYCVYSTADVVRFGHYR